MNAEQVATSLRLVERFVCRHRCVILTARTHVLIVGCHHGPIYIHRSMLSRHSFNIINQLPGDADTYLAYVTEHCVHVVFVLVQIKGQVCIGVSSLGACKQVQPKWPQV